MLSLWRSCIAQIQENVEIMNRWQKGFHRLPEPVHPETDGAYREKVYQYGQATLYRYPGSADGENRCATPMLIVYALVNRPYMLDLSPKRSFIRGLLKAGMDVYLIEWKNPYHCIQKPTLEDYIQDSIHNVVNWIRTQHEQAKINLMGICQGGVFSLIYTALHPQNIKGLIPVVTPVDFHAGNNLFTHMAKHCDSAEISEALQVIPGDMLNMSFLQIRPFGLMVGKYLGMNKIIDNSETMDLFSRMEQWIFDSPGFSGPAWHQFIQKCYKDNQLVNNQLQLGKRTVDLTQVTCPVLSVTAEKDTVVPPESSEPLGKVISSTDYTHRPFPVGHIGTFVGGVSNKKIIPAICNWLIEHE